MKRIISVSICFSVRCRTKTYNIHVQCLYYLSGKGERDKTIELDRNGASRVIQFDGDIEWLKNSQRS
jgi:hypothetical protein